MARKQCDAIALENAELREALEDIAKGTKKDRDHWLAIKARERIPDTPSYWTRKAELLGKLREAAKELVDEFPHNAGHVYKLSLILKEFDDELEKNT